MGEYKFQLVESLVSLLFLVLVYAVFKKATTRAFVRFNFELQRRKVISKLINLTLIIAAAILLIAIWGVDQDELIVFLSSLITILGVAFFAQWSLLSNITSGLILFFNHPLKLGQQIRILDKDYEIKGTVEDITYFFLYLKTESGELITLPNSIVLQKVVLIEIQAA